MLLYEKKTFAMLGAQDISVGPYIAEAMGRRGLLPSLLVLDRRPTSERDVDIHAMRTGGALPLATFPDSTSACPVVVVDNHNDDGTIQLIADINVDFLVNAGTPRILSKQFLTSLPPALNCHPGLLPWFRGSSAVEWAVLLDEPVGNSVHIMSAGIDEGAVVATKPVQHSAGDTYQDLRVRTFRHGFEFFADVVESIVVGQRSLTDSTPQPDGRYFRPPTEAQIDQVIALLKQGHYSGTKPLGHGDLVPQSLSETGSKSQ